jgi:hypothetical protein
MKTEIQKMLRYDHLSDESQDLVTTRFGQQIPAGGHFLCWADVIILDTVVVPYTAIMETCSC